MRTLARFAVALAALALIAGAVSVSVHLYQRTVGENTASHRVELYRDGRRLRDISNALAGSTLPPARSWCERWMGVDEQRTGHRYPPRGSADRAYVVSVCTDTGR